VNFSVADFVPLANTAIADIVSRGKQPIIVGGTGLYIKSLRDGIDFSTDSADHAVRERLLREADSINKEGENSVYFPNSSVKSNAGTSTNSIHPHDSNALSPDKNPVPLGNMVMWRRLLALDPESAALIPPQNITRVIRALEISETTGIPFSDYKRAQVRGNADYDFRGVFLDFADRAKLYDRINRRVDAMMKAGMVDECEKAYRSGTFTGTTVSQAIGYKELIPYFNGETDLQTVTETIKQSTRRYAKRQLTWFRHDNALFHVEIPNNDNLNNSAEKNFKIIYEFFSKQ
jgi:tRNA dimethylallyltransferase